MCTTIVDIGTLIMRSPEIHAGQSRIAGTGVTVQRIVAWYKLRLTAEEIADEIGHLTLAQVHDALAYYNANRDGIEADLQSEEDQAQELQRQQAGNPGREWTNRVEQ